LEQAGDAVSAIVASGLLPGAIEIMDALALEAAKAAVHADYPPHCEAVLIVELEGPREAVAADRLRLDALLSASQPVEARPARNPAERLAIWKGRKSAFSAVGRLSPDFIVQDGGRVALCECVPCRRRQPASTDSLQRPQPRGTRAG
jgi:glycolate oxidase